MSLTCQLTSEDTKQHFNQPTKESATHTTHRVPDEIKRREVELDPQVSPERILSREVELGCESWTSFASSCSPKQCNGHCLCDSAQSRQLKLAIARCPSRWAMARRHRLNTSTFTLPVFFGRYPRSSLHRDRAFTLSPPPPPQLSPQLPLPPPPRPRP